MPPKTKNTEAERDQLAFTHINQQNRHSSLIVEFPKGLPGHENALSTPTVKITTFRKRDLNKVGNIQSTGMIPPNFTGNVRFPPVGLYTSEYVPNTPLKLFVGRSDENTNHWTQLDYVTFYVELKYPKENILIVYDMQYRVIAAGTKMNNIACVKFKKEQCSLLSIPMPPPSLPDKDSEYARSFKVRFPNPVRNNIIQTTVQSVQSDDVVIQEPIQANVAALQEAVQEAIQEIVAPVEPIQEIVAPEGPIQEIVAPVEPIQEIVAPPEPIQEIVAPEEPVQEIVAPEEPVQEIVAPEEPVQEIVAPEEPIALNSIGFPVFSTLPAIVKLREKAREALSKLETIKKEVSDEEANIEALERVIENKKSRLQESRKRSYAAIEEHSSIIKKIDYAEVNYANFIKSCN
jgi:hypothetical protein